MRINDPEDGPEEESEEETRSRESEECDEEEIERRRAGDRHETLNVFPSKAASSDTKPGQKVQAGCYRHYTGSCELGDKCEYSHSKPAMEKICSDTIEKNAKFQHISVAEQHKLLDQFSLRNILTLVFLLEFYLEVRRELDGDRVHPAVNPQYIWYGIQEYLEQT